MTKKITVIRPVNSRSVGLPEKGDRLGSVAHGAVTKAVVSAVGSFNSDEFLKNLTHAVNQAEVIVKHLKSKAGSLKPKEITLGLAVSAEGGIGIATVGTEASIEVTFELS